MMQAKKRASLVFLSWNGSVNALSFSGIGTCSVQISDSCYVIVSISVSSSFSGNDTCSVRISGRGISSGSGSAPFEAVALVVTVVGK